MRKPYKVGGMLDEEMPDLKSLVVGQIKPQLEAMAKQVGKEMRPLIGLSHGESFPLAERDFVL
eukprot:642615-Amphidinium_carterae.1